MYHAFLVNAKLRCLVTTDCAREEKRSAFAGGCGPKAVMLPQLRSPAAAGEIRPGQCDGPRLHEVDARMTPQNAHRPLPEGAAGAFPADHCGMAHRAEALSIHHAFANARAIKIARRSAVSLSTRARRKFNVHAHADRCAPPGRDPGRGRQREPDRGV